MVINGLYEMLGSIFSMDSLQFIGDIMNDDPTNTDPDYPIKSFEIIVACNKMYFRGNREDIIYEHDELKKYWKIYKS